jgi:hypothetical protein
MGTVEIGHAENGIGHDLGGGLDRAGVRVRGA